MISETHVRAAVMRWLYRNGWGYPDPKEKAEHGPDIRARNIKYARYFIIEAKGDPINAKSPDSSRTASFWNAIGQIVTRMKHPKALYYYGIAFPISFQKKIKNLPWQFCQKNRLSVFLVDQKHRVQHLTWKKLQLASRNAAPAS